MQRKTEAMRGQPRYVVCPHADCRAVFRRESVREVSDQDGWICDACDQDVTIFPDWHPTEDTAEMPRTALAMLEEVVIDCLDAEEVAHDATGRLYGVFVDAIRILVRDAGRTDLAYEKP